MVERTLYKGLNMVRFHDGEPKDHMKTKVIMNNTDALTYLRGLLEVEEQLVIPHKERLVTLLEPRGLFYNFFCRPSVFDSRVMSVRISVAACEFRIAHYLRQIKRLQMFPESTFEIVETD